MGGGESPALAQALAVLHGRCAGVAQVHPTTSRLVLEATGSTDVARVVKRRRYLIERAREAKVVGIVAGTLGVAGYLTAIERLRRVIAASGRKSYTVVAGKPNPQKLANFPEIEAFVLVACEQAAQGAQQRRCECSGEIDSHFTGLGIGHGKAVGSLCAKCRQTCGTVCRQPVCKLSIGCAPGDQLSSWRSRLRTSPSMSASRVRRSSISLTAWITVEWSRPPNLRPISG